MEGLTLGTGSAPDPFTAQQQVAGTGAGQTQRQGHGPWSVQCRELMGSTGRKRHWELAGLPHSPPQPCKSSPGSWVQEVAP